MKNTVLTIVSLILILGSLMGMIILVSSLEDDLFAEDPEVSDVVTDSSSGNNSGADDDVDVGTTAPETMPDGVDVPNDGSNDKYTVSYFDESGNCGYVSDGSLYYFYTRYYNNTSSDQFLILEDFESYGSFHADIRFLPNSYGYFGSTKNVGNSCAFYANSSSDVCYTVVSVSPSVDPIFILEDLKQNVFGNDLYLRVSISNYIG